MALSLGDRPLHRLSVDDVLGMVAAGTLGEDDRVELLEGALVDMSPKSPEHTPLLTVLGPGEAVTAPGLEVPPLELAALFGVL